MDNAGEMSIERSEKIDQIRTYIGYEMSTRDVSSALSQSLEDVDATIDLLLCSGKIPFKVRRTLAGAGARISAGTKQEPRGELEGPKGPVDTSRMSFGESLRATNAKAAADDEYLRSRSAVETEVAVRIKVEFGSICAEKPPVSEAN